MQFQELDDDQRRERVNTQQRHAAWREAKATARGYRGSLVWHAMKGEEYLVRSYYDSSGNRRQKSEGKRGPETERLKADWDRGRVEAAERLKSSSDAVARQAAVNRAVGLARVPLLGARIIRAIDEASLLGNVIRIVGTNALYAFEAAAGVVMDPGITTKPDVGLLMGARRHLRIAAGVTIPERTLIALLKQVDRSFERTAESFRASNKDGYLVDLIGPPRSPPPPREREQIGPVHKDLSSAAITTGLAWLVCAPPFETVVTDERGGPLRIVTTDPRVFAAHKLWMSQRADRDPAKRRRDEAQARAVAQLAARYLTNLPYEEGELRMIPRELFERARPMFETSTPKDPVWS